MLFCSYAHFCVTSQWALSLCFRVLQMWQWHAGRRGQEPFVTWLWYRKYSVLLPKPEVYYFLAPLMAQPNRFLLFLCVFCVLVLCSTLPEFLNTVTNLPLYSFSLRVTLMSDSKADAALQMLCAIFNDVKRVNKKKKNQTLFLQMTQCIPRTVSL